MVSLEMIDPFQAKLNWNVKKNEWTMKKTKSTKEHFFILKTTIEWSGTKSSQTFFGIVSIENCNGKFAEISVINWDPCESERKMGERENINVTSHINSNDAHDLNWI